MSDTAPAMITIYNVGGKEGQVASILSHHGFGLSWGDGSVDPQDIVSGRSYFQDEAIVGILFDIGPELQTLGVSYRASQDAKYEYDSLVRLFTPNLGVRTMFATQHGDPLVSAESIHSFLAELTEQVDLTDPGALATLTHRLSDLDDLAGGPWLRELDELQQASENLLDLDQAG